VQFSYDADGRMVEARRYFSNGQEDECRRVIYSYGTQLYDASFTQNAAGRLAAVATGWGGNGCQWTGLGVVVEMYSYTAAGAVTKKRMRVYRGVEIVDKDVTYSYGPDGKLATVLYPGASVPYTYTYDLMDRPTKMTGAGFLAGDLMDHVWDVAYNTVGQVTSMKYLQGELEYYTAFPDGRSGAPVYFEETKEYNPLFQMTRQRATGRGTNGVYGTTLVDIEYGYAAHANNGRITSRKNNVSVQDVAYTYDALNRLISATNSGTGAWTQGFRYDGFGNLREQDAVNGVTPEVLLDVNMSTNRMSAAGWSYDANGNTISMLVGGATAMMSYDVDNRLVTWMKGSVGTEEYRYLPDNKRVWKKSPNGTETVYFYGAGGQKLGTYVVQTEPFRLAQQSVNVYFGGKLIRADLGAVVQDRLGSTVWRATDIYSQNGGVAKDYFPYGDEIGSSTAGNVDKFATYHRDQTTGLDYADQRYFTGLQGRFLTADPFAGSAVVDAPASWNRYSYTWSDPVNLHDPKGLAPAVTIGNGIGGSCFFSYFGGGIGDAASQCPPGYMLIPDVPGGGGSASPLQQVFSAFDGLQTLINDWEYSGTSGRVFDISISDDFSGFTAFVQSSACGCPSLSQIFIDAGKLGSELSVRLTLPLVIALNQIFNKGGQPIGRPRTVPPGTVPIDKYPDLTKDQIHDIKRGVGNGPRDWTGIDPNGDVITGSPGGGAVNHGPWRDYVK
jgi:RHS repeat-associated protein